MSASKDINLYCGRERATPFPISRRPSSDRTRYLFWDAIPRLTEIYFRSFINYVTRDVAASSRSLFLEFRRVMLFFTVVRLLSV